MNRALLMLAFTLAGCGAPTTQDVADPAPAEKAPAQTKPVEKAAVEKDTPAKTAPMGKLADEKAALEKASADACVTECTRANQMRAVDPASIVSDCRKSCADKATPLDTGTAKP